MVEELPKTGCLDGTCALRFVVGTESQLLHTCQALETQSSHSHCNVRAIYMVCESSLTSVTYLECQIAVCYLNEVANFKR